MIIGGRYELVKKLAGGGMGEVFAAQMRGAEGFTKPVALKRIYPHLAGNPRHRELFVREAKLVAQLTHPNIVQVIDFGADDDGLFMAMEFVQGVTMAQLLKAMEARGEAMSIDVVVAIATDLLEALAYAHDFADTAARITGIVHADVSPQNVMLTPLGRAKLCDFGVAKLLRSSSYEATRRERWGKVRYMAPEQLESNQVDARTDVYAIAVIMIEALTGRPAFDGGPAELARAIILGERTSLAERAPQVPGAIAEVIEQACARNPAARFQSAEAMLRSLSDVTSTQALGEARRKLQELVRLELPTEAPQPISTTGSSTSSNPDQPADGDDDAHEPTQVATIIPGGPARGRRPLAFAMTAAAVVVLGVCAVMFMRLTDSSSVTPSAPTNVPPSPSVAVPPTPTNPVPSDSPVPPPVPPTPVVATPQPVELSRRTPPTPSKRTDAPARLTLNAIPWAYVTIDGRPLEKATPVLDFALTPGRHSVQLSGANGKTATLVLNVAPGEVVKRVVRLE